MTDASMPGNDLPHGDEPGAGSTPNDDGEGTVGLADRLDDGAPAANQGKVEPVPPTPAHTDPEASSGGLTAEGLDLDAMSMGSAAGQLPSHPEGGTRPDHTSTAVEEVAESGTAQRAPASQGVSPEPIGTDRAASAAAMSQHHGPCLLRLTRERPGGSGVVARQCTRHERDRSHRARSAHPAEVALRTAPRLKLL